MIAKYSGRCVECGKPTMAGKDQYDFEKKENYHEACRGGGCDDPEAIAESLGYQHYSWDFLRSVFASSEARDGDGDSASGRDAIRQLSASNSREES